MDLIRRIKDSFLKFVIGIVFLSIGLGITGITFVDVSLDYIQTSSWKKTPINIHALSLTEDGKANCIVKARYDYVFEGEHYTSEQVALIPLVNFKSYITDYWHTINNRLREELEADKSYAFVNPKNPAKAVLDRPYHWRIALISIFFLPTFGAIGFFFLLGILKQKKVALDDTLINGIECENRDRIKFVPYTAGVFFLITISAWLLSGPGIANYLFLILGLLSFFAVARNRTEREIINSLNPSKLILNPAPAIIGQPVNGYLDIISQHLTQEFVRVILKCEYRPRHGDDDKYHRTLFKDSKRIAIQAISNDISRIKFTFECPEDLQDYLPTKNNDYYWSIILITAVELNDENIPIQLDWSIPVVKNDYIFEPKEGIMR